MFPVTSDGLSGGWSAYGALYGAAVGASSSKSRGKRRNRFSSVRCGMSAEEVQEIFFVFFWGGEKVGGVREVGNVGSWVVFFCMDIFNG